MCFFFHLCTLFSNLKDALFLPNFLSFHVNKHIHKIHNTNYILKKNCLVVQIRGIMIVTASFILQGAKNAGRKVDESYLPLLGASLEAEATQR